MRDQCQNDANAPRRRYAYDRHRDLPRLLPLTATPISKGVLADRRRVVALLRRALSRERRRALAGHWAHDAPRHRLLLEALRCETSPPEFDQP